MAPQQVRVEAVFETAGALASANQYRAAIDACRQAHAALGAAMGSSQSAFGTLASGLAATRSNATSFQSSLVGLAAAVASASSAQRAAVAGVRQFGSAIDSAKRSVDGLNASLQRTITLGIGVSQALNVANLNLSRIGTSAQASAQQVDGLAAAYGRAATAANRLRSPRGGPWTPAASGQPGGGQGGGAASGRSIWVRSIAFDNELGNTIRGVRNDLAIVNGLVSALAAITLTRNLIEYADKWTETTGRIKLALGEASRFEDENERLFSIAQKARADFADVGNMFSRIYSAGKFQNMSPQFAEGLVETIANMGLAARRTGSEMRSLLTQIPQAISSGVVAGDEFRSILESAGPLVGIIAKNFEDVNGKVGVTIGRMRQLSRDQEIKPDQFFNAVLRGRQEIEALAQQAPRTFDQALTQLGNDWLRTVGRIANQTGFVDSLTGAIDKIRAALTGPEGVATIRTMMTVVKASITGLVDAITSDAFLDAVSQAGLWLLKFGEDILRFARNVNDAFNVLSRVKAVVGQSLTIGTGPAQFLAGQQGTLPAANDNPIVGYWQQSADLIKQSIDKIRAERAKARQEISPAESRVGQFAGMPISWVSNSTEDSKHLENLKKRMKELTAEAEAQLAVFNAKASGDETALISLEGRLAAEKKITQEMRDKLPEQTKYLQGLTEENARLKIIEANREKDKPFLERLARLKEEADVTRAEMTGNKDVIEQAKARLEIEKITTERLRERNALLAEQLAQQERMNVMLKRQAEQVREWSGMFENAGNMLVDAVFRAGQEGKSFSQGLRDAAGQITQMVIKAVVLEPLIKSIATSMGIATQGATGTGTNIFGFGQSSGILGGGGGLFGGGTVFSEGASAATGGWATTATTAPFAFLPFANGGAFPFGIQRYAAGDVFHTPRYFSHAGGVGQMAEAGPESVMPLFRGRDGKLGVRMSGGDSDSSSTVVNHFHIAGDATDATIAKMQALIDRSFAQRGPGLVRQSVTSVRREIVNDPGFTRR